MSTFLVRNSLGNMTEDGSDLAPFKSLASLHTALGGDLSGHTIELWADDTFDERVNAVGLEYRGHNWVMRARRQALYDSKKPIVTRAMRNLTWSIEPGSNVYVSNEILINAQYGGCISEDGSPLNFVPYTTNRAGTVALMTPGTAAFDHVAKQYLIYPRSGAPSEHDYIASSGVYTLRITNASRFDIGEIDFHHASGGVMWGGAGIYKLLGGWRFHDTEIAFSGGAYSTSFYSGNGLGIVGNEPTYGESFFENAVVKDIFDSGYSPQSWENVDIKGIHSRYVDYYRCGLGSVEFSLTGNTGSQTASVMSNVSARKCRSFSNGLGWSGNRYGIFGHGIYIQTNNSNAGVYLADVEISDNESYDCVGTGVMLHQTNGDGIIATRNYAKGCGKGITGTMRAGYQPKKTSTLSHNVSESCTVGIQLGTGSSGLAGAEQIVENNTAINCGTGVNDITKTGDTTYLSANLIVNCAVGIAKDGSGGTLIRADNYLSGCATPHSGLSQGADTVNPSIIELTDYYKPVVDLPSSSVNKHRRDFNGQATILKIGAATELNKTLQQSL